tara:strand:- start:13077 stop:13802 length:726 start_codon:yes stop_codon:yes gene_type:complete
MFYTTLPKGPLINPSFKRIARFAPIIGLFIGTIQSISWLILSQTGWPKEALAIISIAIAISITGGLHFDGLMDTADGIAAGKKKCLIAMKDSNIGAIGIQSFFLAIAIQIAALIKLDNAAIIAFPIVSFWGRFSSLWAIQNFPYLHEEKTSTFHKLHWCGFQKEIKPSLCILLIIILLLFVNPINIEHRLNLIICVMIGIIPAFIVPNIIGKKLGGHSGDSYGSSLVIVETVNLVLLSIIV